MKGTPGNIDFGKIDKLNPEVAMRGEPSSEKIDTQGRYNSWREYSSEKNNPDKPILWDTELSNIDAEKLISLSEEYSPDEPIFWNDEELNNLEKSQNSDIVIDEEKSNDNKTKDLTETSKKEIDNSKNEKNITENNSETKKSDIKEVMEPPIIIKFKCPSDVDPTEFRRQLKGQQEGLNKQSVKENIDNRARYEAEGRAKEGADAQKIAKEKAIADRIKDNLDKGMSVSEAREEANEYFKDKAALHDPDQVAGGDPQNVTGMGDARINSSIGGQWGKGGKAKELAKAVSDFAEGKTDEELSKIKMNVILEVEDS